MQRHEITPRDGWRRKVEALGLVWHTADGEPYWNEAAYYSFSRGETDAIAGAVTELYRLYLEAGEYVVHHRLFDRFGIPPRLWPLIVEAWEEEPPALNYGRFDLGYDGRGAPKLFEFNCDTPTSLLEAAVVQWDWKEQRFPGLDQFNSLHGQLAEQWRAIAPLLAERLVHFAFSPEPSGEDEVTCAYMQDLATAAGLDSERLSMADIGWTGEAFVDLQGREIRTLYHLYPWEWIAREAFSRHLAATAGRTRWIEPVWKMIWSNKAMLPILWDLFPRHENLLWADADAPRGASYARKPILAREGANIALVRHDVEIASTGGRYGTSPVIYQELYPLPDFAGAHPVLGAWIVDGAPAGLGIREGPPITGNTARFVPHVIA
jgi:glutathionylspermidine synthase